MRFGTPEVPTLISNGTLCLPSCSAFCVAHTLDLSNMHQTVCVGGSTEMVAEWLRFAHPDDATSHFAQWHRRCDRGVRLRLILWRLPNRAHSKLGEASPLETFLGMTLHAYWWYYCSYFIRSGFKLRLTIQLCNVFWGEKVTWWSLWTMQSFVLLASLCGCVLCSGT